MYKHKSGYKFLGSHNYKLTEPVYFKLTLFIQCDRRCYFAEMKPLFTLCACTWC